MEEARPHWRAAFGLAFSLTGDRHRAEDLCQEALLRLARMRHVDRSRPLRPLLLRIVKNLAANEARRIAPVPLEAEPIDTAGSPATTAERRELQAIVLEGIRRLPETWRAMVWLRDGAGLAYAEIADVMETSTDVVRTTLHRARRRLRESLRSRLPEVGP